MVRNPNGRRGARAEHCKGIETVNFYYCACITEEGAVIAARLNGNSGGSGSDSDSDAPMWGDGECWHRRNQIEAAGGAVCEDESTNENL